MPTPFTHLVAAQRLLDDPVLSSFQRDYLTSSFGAFLLGNISPDAHHLSPIPLSREATHFFAYRPQVEPPAIQAFFTAHPELRKEKLKADHAAFVAGYIAHLAVDQTWCEDILFPCFYGGEWGTRESRFFMLHVILSVMDNRDYLKLPPHHYTDLVAVKPDNWLSFMPKEALTGWQHIITEQIKPQGESQTLQILGKRVRQGYEELRAVVESPERLQAELWVYVPPEKLAETEALMYARMVEAVLHYLEG